MAFLVAQGALRDTTMLSALLVLAFAGIVMAGEWAKQDRILVAYLLFRYEMLKQVEDNAGVVFPIFHREENFYKEGNGCITHFGFLAECGPLSPAQVWVFCTSWWLRQLRAS